VGKAGKLTLAPGFIRTLNRQVGRLAGRPLDVLADNAFTEEQVRREGELRRLLADVTGLRFDAGGPGRKAPVSVDDPARVAQLLRAVAPVEVPVRAEKRDPDDFVLTLVRKGGGEVRVTFLRKGPDGEGGDGAPGLADPVEVEGFGQVWVSNGWRVALRDYGVGLEREAAEKRSLETAALVARDWPGFLRQVVNVVAHYQEGDARLTDCLDADRSRPVLAALAGATVEPLDWDDKRWQAELKQLDERGGGYLELTPGLGFQLEVTLTGDKEALVPGVGRVRFRYDVAAAVRRATGAGRDPDKEFRIVPR
jgi:hypothetical protein